MSDRKIKIVQIGICHEHASGKMATLKKLRDLYDIVGYVDENPFSTTPKFTTGDLPTFADIPKLSLEEALAVPGLEAAVVEVPNNELVGMGRLCAERGLAMHLDKPAGESLEPYAELLEICKKKNLPFQMGYMFRGNPAFRFCIDAIRDGMLGNVFELECDMNHCYGGDFYQEYIGSFQGGIMYNLGCHLIDFIVAAMGAPTGVSSFVKSTPDFPNARNNATAVLEYPYATAIVRSCSRHCKNTPDRRMRIAGDQGMIDFSPVERFDGIPIEIKLFLKRPFGNMPAGEHSLKFQPQLDRYETQLRELADMIRNGAKDFYTREHDLLVHKVTLAAAGYINWN